MSEPAPRLSIVIPTMGRETLIKTVESLVASHGFTEIEVLVCGKIADPTVAARLQELVQAHPDRIRHFPVVYAKGDSSEKKNLGFRESRADVVAFLDDDVVVAPDWPRLFWEAFARQPVGLMSGPGLVPPDVNLFARLAGLALASPAAGYVAWRYRSDHEDTMTVKWSKIIGCNMAYRKSALADLGGFDPKFWPGEEMIAAYLAEKRGNLLVFHPKAWVYHYPRHSFPRFWRQIAGYGATRIRLIRGGVECEHTTLVPALWVASLAVLGVAALFLPWAAWLLALDLALYALVDLLITIAMVRETKRPADILLFLMIPIMHLAYGIGSWQEVLRPNRDLSEHIAHATRQV